MGEANAASGVDPSSGAFTANYTSPKVLKRLQAYVGKLQKPVASRKRVVGAIVAINGRVEAVDVFQSTPLFRKLWPKLLQSYALDAAAVARQPDADTVCTRQDATDFLRSVLEANVEKQDAGPGGLMVTKRDSPRAVSFSAAPDVPAAMGGMGMGTFLHSSGFAK